MGDYIAAIDAGTTGITVLLIDRDGLILSRGYSEFPQHFPQPGWVEHDPLEIWSATQDTLAQALSGRSPTDVHAIGITNQRETTVVWDRKTLSPVHNAIVWQCRRSAPICEGLIEQGLDQEIREKTGLVVDAYFSGTKLTWLGRNVDGFSERAAKGELAFGTVDSWLLAKLTSGQTHATDITNASRTMLFDIDRLRWDPRLLEIMDVPSEVLGEVLPSSGRFAMTDPDAFLGAKVPISGVAGDQAAALYGQACFSKGMSKNTYGTGSFVLTNTGAEHPISSHGLLTSVAWGSADQPTYAVEGAIFVTGAAVQWLRDGLQIIGAASETEPLARTVDSTEGVYLVPAFVGLGAPRWDPDARGAILGLSRGSTKAHIARATIEAMAYQTYDVVEAMKKDTGVAISELRVDGGASRMDLLCQFQADLLGVAVVRPKIQETTALGAAFHAGLAEGFWENEEQLSQLWDLDRRFEPTMKNSMKEDLISGWHEAVERTSTR